MSDAIIEIVNMVRLTLTQTKLRIEYTYSQTSKLRFDRRRLQQVILNLLSNAIKFQSEGTITIMSDLKERDNKLFLEVSVED